MSEFDAFQQKVHEIVQKKLDDGSIEKIVSDQIEKAVKEATEQLFNHGWSNREDGEGYKYVKAQIDKLLMDALRASSYENVTNTTRLAIDNLIAQSSIMQTGEALKNYVGLFDQGNDIKFKEEVSLKDIFKQYCEWLSNTLSKYDLENYDIEIVDEEGREEASFDVSCSVEYFETERWTNDKKQLVTLTATNIDDFKETRQFILSKSYDGKWQIMHEPILGLDNLRRMSSFDLFLYRLSSQWASVTDIKAYDDEVTCENLQD